MKKHIPVFAALFMMFVFGYIIPPWSTVSSVGLKILGAFVGWLILVIAGKGMVIASCLGFFALALSGYMTPKELFAAGFGTPDLLQFVYAFLLTGAFTRSGAGEVIVRWTLSRKGLNGRPVLFMLVWWTIMTVLGALTTNVVACMMLAFSLITSISRVVGYKITDAWCRFMIAATIMIGGTAGVLIPFQGPPAMALPIFDAYGADIGISINRGIYCATVIGTSVLVILALTFIAPRLLRLNIDPLAKIDVSTLTDGHSTTLTIQQTTITVVMIISYLYPVLLLPLPKDSAIYAVLSGSIGQPMFMGFAVAILALLHKEGQPFYDLEKYIGGDVMWGAIAAYALVSVAAGALASDAAGIKNWLLELIGSAVANLPLWLVIIVFILIATYLTQVFSNMATIIIVTSVLAPLVPVFIQQGFNLSALPGAILQGGMSAIMTAGGSGFSAMMLGQPAFEGDGTKWALKNGALILLILAICSTITTLTMGYLL